MDYNELSEGLANLTAAAIQVYFMTYKPMICSCLEQYV